MDAPASSVHQTSVSFSDSDDDEFVFTVEGTTTTSPKKQPLAKIAIEGVPVRILVDSHPIPTVDELLQDMSGTTKFSKVDLKAGYHQILLDKESRSITTFTTHRGLFRYRSGLAPQVKFFRMPFKTHFKDLKELATLPTTSFYGAPPIKNMTTILMPFLFVLALKG